MNLIKKLTLSAFLIAVCFVFTGVVSADDDYNLTNPYITINTPVAKKVYYKGEIINYNFNMINHWDNYTMFPYVGISKASDSNKILNEKGYSFIEIGKTETIKDKMTTAGLSDGAYAFVVIGMAIDSENKPHKDIYEGAAKLIYIKTLKAPKKVKATVKKKGIRITYNKAIGASKYEIYRSRKKSSGYKKIITTTRLSYLDKKAKKGKKYYYKVRSVRTVSNTIKSGFSAKSNARR